VFISCHQRLSEVLSGPHLARPKVERDAALEVQRHRAHLVELLRAHRVAVVIRVLALGHSGRACAPRAL